MEPVTVAKLWLLVKPIKRIRIGLARRRARKNGTELYEELPDDIEEGNVIPRGKMTKTGAFIAMAGPFVGMALSLLGVGAECPVDLPDCVPAGEMANTLSSSIGGLITVVGGLVAWRGRNRVKELTGQ